MANVKRIEKAPAGKYAGHKFLDYVEAADYLGIKSSTLYSYISDLEIRTVKFKRNPKKYISMEDVVKIEQAIEKPWLAGEDVRHQEKVR